MILNEAAPDASSDNFHKNKCLWKLKIMQSDY